MKRLMLLRDIKSLAAAELAEAIRAQSQFQSSALAQLRFRRPELNDVFLRIGSSKMASADDSKGQRQWAENCRGLLSASFERLAADGMSWGGNLGNNLIVPLNNVCSHSLHGLMCFDVLMALLDYTDYGVSESGRAHTVNDILGHRVDIKDMLRGSIIPDMESLTKEKFGACPEIAVSAPAQAPVIGCAVPSLLSFVLVELLKNALEAVLNKYGVLDLEDSEMGLFPHACN